MSTIKAICFDLDGVYFTSQGKRSFHQALSEEFGAESARVDEIMYRSQEMRDLVTGKIEPHELWEYIRKETGIKATDEEFVARWIKDYEIDADVQKAVRSAKGQGFITCVCTNNNAARLPALEAKFGFYSDFDAVVSSHEVGYTKPSKEIFEALLEKTGVQANELVYSDDNPERLQGAKDLGINVFVYENFDQFLQELSQLGINL
jgi:putative hydrolase of the HAD superfamily